MDSDFLDLLNLLELFELADQTRMPQNNFRSRRHPFHYYTPDQFHNRYRFTKEAVIYIYMVIYDDNYNERLQNGRALSKMDKLLITLRYYATGSLQRVVGDLTGIEQSTISKVVSETSLKIGTKYSLFIRHPTPEEYEGYVRKFDEKFHFPNVFGLIDGTHVHIRSPGGPNAELFRNRKGFFSINCQLACNADMKIFDFVAR